MTKENTRRGFTQCCCSKAFTLIELLVVVLIIGILAAVALPQYQKAVEKARAIQAVTRVSQLDKAIELWKLSHNEDCSSFWGDVSNLCSALDIDFSCEKIEDAHCLTKDFLYQANPREIIVYSQSNHYYVLDSQLDSKKHFCGWFDSVSKAVCDSLVPFGWDSRENYDV